MSKLMTDAATIQKAINSIKNRGAKLDADIQLCGLSVLTHAAKHGDSTLADQLVNAMPKGGRKLALVEWMLAFGTMRKLDPKTEREAIQAGRLFAHDKSRKLDAEGAAAKPWTEFKKEPDPLTAFDAGAAVASVLSRLKKASDAHITIQNRETALAEARALVAALEKAPVPAVPAPV